MLEPGVIFLKAYAYLSCRNHFQNWDWITINLTPKADGFDKSSNIITLTLTYGFKNL